jgi:hypothetical protein
MRIDNGLVTLVDLISWVFDLTEPDGKPPSGCSHPNQQGSTSHTEQHDRAL